MPSEHAKFSPSRADQYIHCTPSLRLEEKCNVVDDSSYAAEGTDAHTLCEYLLKTALGDKLADPRPNLKYYDSDMQECAEGYRDMVLEHYKQGDFISVEQKINLEDYIPGSFGTSDCVIIGDGHMYVIDFKYGIGERVSAEENPQLKCYAIGAYLAFNSLYEINEITLIIYQPRISNFSEWTLTTESLLDWAETTLRPCADKALKGEGEFSYGKWCKWCKAKPICRKLSEVMTDLAKHEFADPPTLTDEEVDAVLMKIEPMKLWIKAVQAYALQRALSGHKWPNWKVVEGKSIRKYTDETKVAEVVTEAGYDPYKKELMGITAMEKFLGREKFKDLLSGLIIKPKGKPELVSREDKRQEMSNVFEEDES